MPAVVELNDSFEVPVPPLINAILAGLRDTVDPVGETVVEMDTLPAKLSWLVAVTVEVPVEPDKTTVSVGLAVKKKSGGFAGVGFCELGNLGGRRPPA